MDAPVPVDDAVLAQHALPTEDGGTSKFDRGQVLVIGGTLDTPGGVVLAAEAALRAGAGRVHVATVEPVATSLSLTIPEARVTGLATRPSGELAAEGIDRLSDALARADAVLLGSGMADGDETAAILVAVGRQLVASTPLVLDAGVLGALGRDPAALTGRHALVLLPNPGEVASLLGVELDEAMCTPVVTVRHAVDRFAAVVALRASETFVAGPGIPVYVERGGTPALATSGSGDVVAGALAGLLARQVDPLTATVRAVHAHAAAGRELAGRHAGLGLLARELPALLPRHLNQ